MRIGLLAVLLVSALTFVPAVPAEAAWFRRGDADGLGTVNITDAIIIIRYLFLGGQAPVNCRKAADVNDDGQIDLSDGIHLLHFLFLAGPPPAPPFPGCGTDPTEDDLDCESVRPCVGPGIIFVCDRSGSMQEKSKFMKLQQEVTRTIQALEADAFLGLIFFDAGLVKFPASGEPVAASAEMKEAASSLVMSIQTGHGECAKPALIAALEMAGQAPPGNSRIAYYSDGYTNCPGNDAAVYSTQTVAEVTARNRAKIPIDTICIGPAGYVDEIFLRALAGKNGGTYTRIAQ